MVRPPPAALLYASHPASGRAVEIRLEGPELQRLAEASGETEEEVARLAQRVAQPLFERCLEGRPRAFYTELDAAVLNGILESRALPAPEAVRASRALAEARRMESRLGDSSEGRAHLLGLAGLRALLASLFRPGQSAAGFEAELDGASHPLPDLVAIHQYVRRALRHVRGKLASGPLPADHVDRCVREAAEDVAAALAAKPETVERRLYLALRLLGDRIVTGARDGGLAAGV